MDVCLFAREPLATADPHKAVAVIARRTLPGLPRVPQQQMPASSFFGGAVGTHPSTRGPSVEEFPSNVPSHFAGGNYRLPTRRRQHRGGFLPRRICLDDPAPDGGRAALTSRHPRLGRYAIRALPAQVDPAAVEQAIARFFHAALFGIVAVPAAAGLVHAACAARVRFPRRSAPARQVPPPWWGGHPYSLARQARALDESAAPPPCTCRTPPAPGTLVGSGR